MTTQMHTIPSGESAVSMYGLAMQKGWYVTAAAIAHHNDLGPDFVTEAVDKAVDKLIKNGREDLAAMVFTQLQPMITGLEPEEVSEDMIIEDSELIEDCSDLAVTVVRHAAWPADLIN